MKLNYCAGCNSLLGDKYVNMCPACEVPPLRPWVTEYGIAFYVGIDFAIAAITDRFGDRLGPGNPVREAVGEALTKMGDIHHRYNK